jgi:hypothetical protein
MRAEKPKLRRSDPIKRKKSHNGGRREKDGKSKRERNKTIG